MLALMRGSRKAKGETRWKRGDSRGDRRQATEIGQEVEVESIPSLLSSCLCSNETSRADLPDTGKDVKDLRIMNIVRRGIRERSKTR
jgi:hypothetical protein